MFRGEMAECHNVGFALKCFQQRKKEERDEARVTTCG